MLTLKKYELDSGLTYEYLCSNLKNTNKLSSTVLEKVNFQEGCFFTFLCNNINEKRLYQFEHGGIAKDANNKTINLVLMLIKKQTNTSIIFDSFNRRLAEELDDPVYTNYGFYYKTEVYYSLNNENISKESLIKCFNYSDAIWHSLIVLSKIHLDPLNRELSDEQINNICINAQLILVGAYDDESFVFWKRNDFILGEIIESNP